MVKEAVFNIVQFDIEGRRVLDLFAGTGQLGIECLSRGAVSCDFVDSSKAACELIRANLKTTELAGGHVYQSDAVGFLGRSRSYDLIFLDPPYGFLHLDKIIGAVEEFDILHKSGIMVCETDANTILPEVQAPYVKGREYRYGKVKITVYLRA